MASTSSDLTTLDGLFKVQYAKAIQNALPEGCVAQDKIKFEDAAKLGDEYRTPVNVSYEGGVSYLGETGALQALADAVAGQMKEAVVKGSELNIRGFITNKALAASLGGNSKAFKTATAVKVFSLNATLRRRLETSIWYGQDNIGIIESVTDLTGGLATVVLTRASFAPGFWQGVEKHRFETWTAGGARSSTINVGLTVEGVDLSTRTLTVGYTGAFGTQIVVGDTLHWYGSRSGASTYNEMVGMKKIFSNTGSQFGIDASTASVWKGNTDTTGGVCSTALLQKVAVKPANRGLSGKLLAVIPTAAWAEMNIDESALVRRTQGESEGKSGLEGLKIRAACGELEILPSPFVKEGDFFMLPIDEMVRGGAMDVSFSLDGERFFRWLDGYNGYELQAMCDQFIFCNKPSYGVYGSGLTYT